MRILNLTTQKTFDEFEEYYYKVSDSYLILSTPSELNKLKHILDIDEITFKDCLIFDEHIKLDLFDKYDFFKFKYV